MEKIFMYAWNISLQAGIIFCVLLAVRSLFSLCRVPRKYACALWVILMVRLLLPIQPETAFGMMPRNIWTPEWVRNMGTEEDWKAETGEGRKAETDEERRTGEEAGRKVGTEAGQSTEAKRIQRSEAVRNTETGEAWKAETGEGRKAGTGKARESLAGASLQYALILAVWAAGAAAVLGYGLISYGSLKKRVRCGIRLEKEARFLEWVEKNRNERKRAVRIYLVDEIDTPFVMGIISPGVYIPSSLDEKNLPYVIAHEEAHICRRDHLLKLAGFLAAGLYWYHPAVWLGFWLMGRDMETACDEAVIKRIGEASRGDYADSLLQLTCGKRSFAAAPLAFSEENTEGRIKHIMKYKKPAAAAAVFGTILTAFLAVGLLTSRKAAAEGSDRKNPEMTAGEQGNPGVAVGEQTNPGAAAGEQTNLGAAVGEQMNPGTGQEAPARVMGTWYKRQLDDLPPVFLPEDYLEIKELVLDYADDDVMIFHASFGSGTYLYVYQEETGEVTGIVDLGFIGCAGNSEEGAPEIYAAEGGRKVYIHPQGRDKRETETDESGTEQAVIQDEGYCYDRETGELFWISYSCLDAENGNTEAAFRNMIHEELNQAAGLIDRQTLLSSSDDGIVSDRCADFTGSDGVRVYGWLVSTDGKAGSLIYVKGRRCVRLFGDTMEGRELSYDYSTKVTVDGTVYDLAQQSDLTNAVMDVQYADGLWIVEGHINPNVGSYHFYDIKKGEWQECVYGAALTWDKAADGAQADNVRKTMLYNWDTIICDQEGELIDLREELSEKQEYIAGLSRNGDMLTVTLRSDVQREDYRRELRLSVSEAVQERARRREEEKLRLLLEESLKKESREEME